MVNHRAAGQAHSGLILVSTKIHDAESAFTLPPSAEYLIRYIISSDTLDA